MTQKSPSWICIIPFPHFRLRFPPPVSAMLPGGTPTTVIPSPTEEKKSKPNSRIAEEALHWAVELGIGDCLSLTDGSGDAMLGKLNCTCCGYWL